MSGSSWYGLDPAILGVFITGAGLMVSIIIFAAQVRSHTLELRKQMRWQAVSRVQEMVERAARAHALYPVSRIWTNKEMELALALPNLLLNLPRSDRPVAEWVGRQIQLMQLSRKERDALTLSIAVSFRLADWYGGGTSLSWFVAELRKDAYDMHFKVPWRIKATKAARFFVAVLIVIGAAAITRGALVYSFGARDQRVR